MRAHPDEYGFPDIFAEEDCKPVGIEVLEIHDSGRRNRVLENQYTAALIACLKDNLVPVLGLWITIRVEYPKGVPGPSSSRGKILLDKMQRVVSKLLPTYAALKEGGAKRSRQIDPKTSACFDVFAWRIGGNGAQVDVKFPQATDGKLAASVITSPLSKKLRKYVQLEGLSLYLLVVEWDRNIKTEDAFHRAKKAATSISHPFKEIWHMMPYPKEKLGSIHQIWPPVDGPEC